jgi:hypothetical protein
MDLCTVYLQQLNVLIKSDEDASLLNPDPEPIEDYNDGEAKYNHEVGHANTVLMEFKADTAPLFTYKMAKKPPFPNTMVAWLTSAYDATKFLPVLQIFLNHNMPCNVPTLKPNQFDHCGCATFGISHLGLCSHIHR